MKQQEQTLFQTFLILYGKHILPPGIHSVQMKEYDIDCYVQFSMANNYEIKEHDLKYDVSDSTIFIIEFYNLPFDDFTHEDFKYMDLLLEKSLMSISELILFYRSKEVTGRGAVYMRQFGRVDIKLFFIVRNEKYKAMFRDASRDIPVQMGNIIGGFFQNVINTNAVDNLPINYIVRRHLGCTDLMNLGFFTEAFIIMFSLMDDLVQETVMAGFHKKGITDKKTKKDLMMSIKEQRLITFTTHFMRLCDWEDLSITNNKLFKELDTVNKFRNKIMHGNMRLFKREEAIQSINTIINVINWLRTNPFGFSIPVFPLGTLINPTFIFFDDINPDNNKPEQSH